MNVVPAFFSPDRSAVVAEAEGEIRVYQIADRSIRAVAEGMAPRLVPFSDQFVFVRERSTIHDPLTSVRRILYDVYRSSFEDPEVEWIGDLRAVSQDDINDGVSPVRWMVVTEAGEGFVLRGENVETFPLPAPQVSPSRNR